MHVARMFCSFTSLFFGIATLISVANTAVGASPTAALQSDNHYTSLRDDDVNNAVGSASPKQMLSQVAVLSSQGKRREALELAQQAYRQGQSNPAFVIGYINSLSAMVETDRSRVNNDILNAAIKAADRLNKTGACNGQADAESAYNFMVAIGQLADKIEPISLKIAGQLYTAQGKIAQNLKTNPGFPSQSLDFLGQPLINLAKAKAIKEDEMSALQIITDAFEIGYVDFDAVANEPLFASVDQEELQSNIANYRSAYQRKVKSWSKRELANFQRFQISFDVARLNGRRIKSSDLRGKIAVIDLWATWCAPCRDGIPHFQKLHQSVDADQVAVIGISMDNPENPATVVDDVKTFAMDADISYPLAVGSNQIKTQIPGKVLLPTTLFIDASGTVRYVASGVHNFTQMTAIVDQLQAEAELNGKSASK